MMRRWLRHVENLSDIKEEMIHICEPETRRNLNDEEEKRSDEDLINCQVGRKWNFKLTRWEMERDQVEVSNTARGAVSKSSDFQVGNEMGSVDLIDCQVDSRKFPNCQVGREKEMRLSESLESSEVSSCQ
jgi:hypothetical protein